MSETIATVARPRRGGWILATVGVSLVVLAMIVAALVIWDKQHFGWLVGSAFLPVLTSGVLVGSILVLAGALLLPRRKSWQAILLIVWALIALTSPLFGFLFLLPWAVLAVLLPVVIVALVGLRRESSSRRVA
jgi:hypothetical protein